MAKAGKAKVRLTTNKKKKEADSKCC